MVEPGVARAPRMSAQVVAVGAGLAILGVASFGYLVLTGRALGPSEVASLATLWVLINAVGPSLFLPLEQELGRSVAARRALGQGSRPVLARAGRLGAAMVGALAVTCLALSIPLSDSLFGGEVLLVAGLVLGCAGLALEHVSRGLLAGNGQFVRYGAQLGIDGVLRLGGAGALALAGATQAGWYGVLLGLSPLAAAALTVPRPAALTSHGPPAEWRDIGSALGWLVAGSAAAQFVVNAAPIAAGLLAGPGERARLGVFISVVVFARMPLFAFAAVQAVLLPGLAALAARGDLAGFGARLRRILGVVAAAALGGGAVLVAVGPPLVTLLFGSQFRTTREILLPLVVAGGLYMIATVLSQALISLRRYAASALGWAGGGAAFLVALLAPLEFELRTGYALLAATVVSVGALAAELRRALGGTPTPPAA